ncbi:hypothetical protein BD289DRAFT_370312 [Coniella lustricola]|uniref:Zn(2)-C6 fungal-type domain-containing protein n=1 Tax=Coniella lustricola TaxID=2025994 RepID=A0A2T3A5G3_9PEZI|nr:hypothetical protein BD289DRAFT_370312 [Coniella lustricola]
MQPLQKPKKRIRKSRGKGLRTTSGCLTCRKRHKKCDERQPVCGPCSISSRECVYAAVASGPRPSHGHSPPSPLQQQQQQQPQGQQLPSPLPTAYEVGYPQYPSHASPSVAAHQHLQQQYAYSPDTVASELLTADLASTRWFDLLASDAAQADKGFSLAPTRHATPVGQTAAGGAVPDEHTVPSILQPASQQTSALPVTSQYPWQLDQDIALQSHEIFLFRTFVEHAALWLDLFHPERHFSTHATRLALRNLGLMKAILALTSRHAIASAPTDDKPDVNVPIQYYYETLQYVQDALQYTSYTRSEELLATVIIISTYEMLDDSNNSNWKRHLKGVFWIQRSQDVNGASGGLRQAVWWAWLRQDLWAAFREKRACFSFWRPLKDVSELTQNELANRAVYLLSQAVNYRAHSESPTMTMADKISSGERILAALDQWQMYLGPGYRPLPTVTPPAETPTTTTTTTTPTMDAVFKPIWIHPPQYAVAVQAYHFAKILITLHRPAVAGFHGYLQTQRILSDAVDAICGIAMELEDEGCQMLSAECLFGAGLCTQDVKSRDAIIALIRRCEARTGWPMTKLIEDLRAEWASFS